MTLVASILFLAAMAASMFAIAVTIGSAKQRIRQVIELEFSPEIKLERRISFGTVRRVSAVRPADVVAFPSMARIDQDMKWAA